MKKAICSQDDCSGCGACTTICPKNCIQLVENEFKEFHPQIEENKCLNCGKCLSVCPQIHIPNLREPRNVYAGWRKSIDDIKDSASGGAAAFISEKWIKNGGVVVGAEYDTEFFPKLKIEKTLEGIKKFKGSKYVYSGTDNVYFQVLENLKHNKQVLFFGLPCQIAAMINVLNSRLLDDEKKKKLVTVEILCHGVVPYDYFKEEINYLKNKKNIGNFDNITFRSNRYQRNYTFCFTEHEKIKYFQFSNENPYYYGFSNGLTLQESCFNCKFKNRKRAGDILIGDFLGLNMRFNNFNELINGKSLIISYSTNGDKCINELLENDRDRFKLVKRSISEAVKGGPSLRTMPVKHESRELFRKCVSEDGYIEARNRVIIPAMKVNGLKSFLRYCKYKLKTLGAYFGIYQINDKIYINLNYSRNIFFHKK